MLLLAAVLNLLFLGQNGYGNSYYAAAARSMLTSWHAFFFASFDPGGFVTVDKPPLALWVQTVSAWLFGFNGLSLILPQAVAGIAAVGLIYHLVARSWNRTASLIAALVLAVMPITTAINRDNNPDPLMVLTLLLAAWATFKATETGRLRYALITGALVGIGFNLKMMQALIVVPALGLTYLLGAPGTWRRKLAHLGAALGMLTVVGGSWATVVDLTPANQRPYVGGSTNNSEFNLIFGYNGLGRIFGQAFGRATADTRSTATATQLATTGQNAANRGPQGGNGGMFGTGNPGILRLVKAQVGAQFAWLLPFVAWGLMAVWERRIRLPMTRKQQSLVLWSGWLLTHLVVFSFAQGIFHSYYLTVVGPAIAALSGIGMVALWERYRQGGWRITLLPLALVTTTAYEVYLLWSYTAYRRVLVPVVVAGCVLAVAGLLLARLRGHANHRLVRGAATLGLLALLVSPGVWSATTLLKAGNAVMPTAGPQGAFGDGGPGGAPGLQRTSSTPTTTGTSTTGTTAKTTQSPIAAAAQNGGGAGGGFGEGLQSNTALITYLEAHQGTTTNLVATVNAQTAESIILATGKPVMALGGFSGSDQILTVAQLVQLAQNNSVRYFLIDSGGMGGPPICANLRRVERGRRENVGKAASIFW